ncbi:MAG: tRNA-uridine aminocarboxypropyltransferase [Marinomonas sp.]
MKVDKRARCNGCRFLAEQCVCQWIPKLKTTLKVLVIQDPKEAKHAKNTVSLLCLGLPSVECISIDDRNLLEANLSEMEASKWRLVFPCDDAVAVESMSRDDLAQIEGVILLDATWRKAKKMYFTEPLLSSFRAITFSQPPEGKYAIRKSPNDVSVSTLEACAYIVEQITEANMQPLRDFMVVAQDWQWRKQPVEHRHNNGH